MKHDDTQTFFYNLPALPGNVYSRYRPLSKMPFPFLTGHVDILVGMARAIPTKILVWPDQTNISIRKKFQSKVTCIKREILT